MRTDLQSTTRVGPEQFDKGFHYVFHNFGLVPGAAKRYKS
jgi:hypothetical protein